MILSEKDDMRHSIVVGSKACGVTKLQTGPSEYYVWKLGHYLSSINIFKGTFRNV